MKKRAKKKRTCVVATALLFSIVAPSMIGVVQAKDIQVNQKASKISDLLEQIACDEADLVFLQQKERELMERRNMPLLAVRAFAPRTVGRNLEGVRYTPAAMRKTSTAVGFGRTQIKAIARSIYIYSYGAIATKIATAATWTWVLGAVIGVSSAAVIYVMGIFY
ncbi:hypothetical protein [Lactococcus ileimucosae]|uniref:hypothetical protein n=1 Tax=Lactococcus ileimucosae TaxID=2941329 RepID=UPI0035166E10